MGDNAGVSADCRQLASRKIGPGAGATAKTNDNFTNVVTGPRVLRARPGDVYARRKTQGRSGMQRNTGKFRGILPWYPPNCAFYVRAA